MPTATTLVTEPLGEMIDLKDTDTVTYTIQVASQDGTEQDSSTDLIGLTMTCNNPNLCGTTTYADGGQYTHSGGYLCRIDPVLVAGTYDVKIIMTNAYTLANPPIEATVVTKHLTVTDTRTVPSVSTLESSPADDTIEVVDMATFTMQSRSADGVPQPEDGDTYTVLATCNDVGTCNAESYSATATHLGNGLYSATIDPTMVGTYKVVVRMMGAYTDANPSTTTIVSDSTTLTVVDTRTVPSASTLVTSPADDTIEVVEMATFTMQSRSADGVPQPEDGDTYTVLATCNDVGTCNAESYSATATHLGNGLYSATIDPTMVGTYKVVVRMMGAYTDANPWTTTLVSDSTTLTVVDTRTTPNSSTLESSPAGDTIEVVDMATFTMQSRSADGVARLVDDDTYTVALTCNDMMACGTESYTATATYTGDGQYSATLDPTMVGTYDVDVSMTNAYTAVNGGATVLA